MSYVIQNFSKNPVVLKLSYRNYFVWLLKNITPILNLFLYNSNLFYGVNSLFFKRNKPFLLRLYFSRGFIKLFSKISLYWRPILANNLIKSCEYWSFNISLTMLKRNSIINTPKIYFKENLFKDQFFLEKKYINIPFNNKYYRQVLISFLYLLLTNWQVWRKSYYTQFTFSLVKHNLSLLKLYNTRFLKIYNV